MDWGSCRDTLDVMEIIRNGAHIGVLMEQTEHGLYSETPQ